MKVMIRSLLLILSCLSGAVLAQQQAAREPRQVDRIVAVVNDEVITAHELRSRLDVVVTQLKKKGTQLPPQAELER